MIYNTYFKEGKSEKSIFTLSGIMIDYAIDSEIIIYGKKYKVTGVASYFARWEKIVRVEKIK